VPIISIILTMYITNNNIYSGPIYAVDSINTQCSTRIRKFPLTPKIMDVITFETGACPPLRVIAISQHQKLETTIRRAEKNAQYVSYVSNALYTPVPAINRGVL